MAENMLWIMRQHPESKAVLWAHNTHVNLKDAMTPLARPMGYFLKEAIGNDYLSVGFICYEGRFTAWKNGLNPVDLPEPVPGTLEYVLGQLDEPLFLLDLKKMREDRAPAMRWIDELEFREIGATPELFYKKRVSESFDYLIFIRNSSPSHIL